jgi:hypothetical protein
MKKTLCEQMVVISALGDHVGKMIEILGFRKVFLLNYEIYDMKLFGGKILYQIDILTKTGITQMFFTNEKKLIKVFMIIQEKSK